MGNAYFVIFGAAVRPDGSPSGTLARRVEGAWRLGQQCEGARYLVTGGQGRHGPPEAQVMKDLLLGLGARDVDIVVDAHSQDTLDSAIHCARLLRTQTQGFESVTVCSSPYHNFRCQMLLRMLGIPARRGRMPSDRPALGLGKWLYYWVREAAAIPWDALQMGLHLFRRRAVLRDGSEP